MRYEILYSGKNSLFLVLPSARENACNCQTEKSVRDVKMLVKQHKIIGSLFDNSGSVQNVPGEN